MNASVPQPVLSAVRMADEGIPIRAIARAMHLPPDDIYSLLRTAIEQGFLVELPKDDWPQGSTRNGRRPVMNPPFDDDNELRLACARYFKASRLEAGFLSLLLRRNEVTREQLHHVIETNRVDPKEPTDQKMVDVVICKLRKKLPPHGFQIDTIWSFGYAISPSGREIAINKLVAMSTEVLAEEAA